MFSRVSKLLQLIIKLSKHIKLHSCISQSGPSWVNYRPLSRKITSISQLVDKIVDDLLTTETVDCDTTHHFIMPIPTEVGDIIMLTMEGR